MSSTPFPIVSNSQELGKLAELAFLNSKPTSWWEKSIDGDSDFGLDYLIQFKDKYNSIKYNFFLQLKGTKDTDKIKETEIIITLKASTLNYYRNNGLVILVVCDLNTNECYYEFLHTILDKLNENKRYLEDTQKTYTIHIPKEQTLNSRLDIESILESYANGIYDIHRKQTILEDCDIQDSFEDSEEDYIEEKHNSENHYLRKKGRVYVDAFIPNSFDFNISCLITFKLSNSKNAMITPNEKTIIKELFSGYKSKPNSSARNWIIGIYKDEFIIQIGNVRLTVPPQVIIDLSDILDELFEVYSLKIKSFEDKLQSRIFPVSKKYFEGFKLIKIKRGLWYHIHKFAQEHGFRDGNDKWSIFGYDNYFLRVNFNDKNFIWSGNIIIAPEVDDSYINYKSYDDELILIWNSLPNEKYERKNIEDSVLNVKETHTWLVDKLIPQVIFGIEKENIHKTRFEQLFNIKKELTYKQFISSYQSSKYIIWDYANKDNVFDNKLIRTINKLQQFYRNQNDVFINIDILINLYEGLITLLKETNYSDLSYLRGNLNDLEINELNLVNFINAIENKILNIKEGTTNEFRIDLILRCYIVIVEKKFDNFSSKFIDKIYNYLDEIKKLMDLLEIRHRQLNRLT
jgi:hypothetical protein